MTNTWCEICGSDFAMDVYIDGTDYRLCSVSCINTAASRRPKKKRTK